MHNLALFFLMRPRPPSSTLFPYTTLFRSREVLLNEGARFLLGDAQLAGERERSLPVDGAEVDRLGARPHLGCHLPLRHAEDDRRGLTMDVTALFEGLDEGRVAREVGEHAQL